VRKEIKMIRNQLNEIIMTAIDKFYQNDFYLLEHDVHEQTISSTFACYLRDLFKEKNLQWNIDPEYNRNGENPKRLTGIGNVRPDIIIHLRGLNNDRGTEQNNLLVIEMKKDPTDKKIAIDMKKIQAFIEEPPFSYCYGLFIGLMRNRVNNRYVWSMRDGQH